MLSREEEARYGYLAAVNSTTLADGVALDLGGGSMQLTRVEGREARDMRSWPLGAVRMTERFLPAARRSRASSSRRCASTSRRSSRTPAGCRAGRAAGAWSASAARCATSRAAAEIAAELPSFGVQGFRCTRNGARRAGGALRGAAGRGARDVPGIKPERGDLILAGAVVGADA